MKYIKNMNTKIGMITIIEEENQIIAIEINKKREEECIKKDTLLLKETEKQLMEYLEGKRREFNVPLNPKGTKFMKAVWTALQDIPYGEVRTYKQIAEKVGNPKAARAVGMANHRNPIPIMIPCHRVIGSNGKLVGYALGMEKKRYLLEWEKKNNV
ncbi:MAG: methylated-DNA--[protein]-cysteine S-methyltransferase [Clostridia bacterium]|nr:methylated-DNA--[protein]-cysteine S-methyltransferase [Clostridia bacterium]